MTRSTLPQTYIYKNTRDYGRPDEPLIHGVLLGLRVYTRSIEVCVKFIRVYSDVYLSVSIDSL